MYGKGTNRQNGRKIKTGREENRRVKKKKENKKKRLNGGIRKKNTEEKWIQYKSFRRKD